MRTELRFVVAIALMMGVLVGTNLLFPPIVPEEPAPTEVQTPPAEDGSVAGTPSVIPQVEVDGLPEPQEQVEVPGVPDAENEPERVVMVEGPLYQMAFSNRGAVVQSIRLLGYESFTVDGPVELVEDPAAGMLGSRLIAGQDTVDLTGFTYSVTPEAGLSLSEGGGPQTLTFRYDHPEGRFFSEIRYTFQPDRYLVQVEGDLPGLERAAVFVDLGPGLALNEVDEAGEVRMMTFAGNSSQDGITARAMSKVDEPEIQEGPLQWGASKTKFFMAAILREAPEAGGEALAGIWAEPASEGRARVQVGAPIRSSGAYSYRAYLGPIERSRLVAIGDDLHEVNPYGFRFMRPIIRPFVGVILTVLNFLHDRLALGYGWVLIVFAIAMRVLLWPLNQKAMRAQIRNMAAQPLMQEIQKKYKNDPEKLQKEMMKLYKEHGFNPLGGCLPMLIPYPVLIALFFVFQNTIELRGESFLWLPDLSASDPLFILPLFLGISMFLLQFISLRTMETANPQMKMMMWMMPIMMIFIFFRLPSGLNLYYAMVNVASLPQQYFIANERKKARGAGPIKAPS